MDPIRIIIFIAAFAALLVIGRLLSSRSEVHAAQLPHPAVPPGPSGALTDSLSPDGEPRAVLTGAEIDFPIQLPPVKRLDDGGFNRPNILNYHFARTDLLRGPADPDRFYDEFFLEAQDPESEHVWTYSYAVATPAGLRQLMDDEKFDSLYFDRVVIVPRWDLKLILGTVMDEIMKVYGAGRFAADEEEQAAGGEG